MSKKYSDSTDKDLQDLLRRMMDSDVEVYLPQPSQDTRDIFSLTPDIY